MPRVVVSMPYFRCRPFVRAAVESILGQTHADLVLCVVNDADPDAPWDELDDLDDERLIRFTLPVNRGPYFAHEVVRRAFPHAEFFAPQDADDTSDPRRLEKLIAAIGACDAAASQLGGDYAGRSHDPRHRKLDATLRHRFCHAGLHRMTALDAIGGYFGGARIGWDTLIMNTHAVRGGVAWVDEKLYSVRARGDSLTHAPETSKGSPERNANAERLAAKYAAIYADPSSARRHMIADVTADDRAELDALAARLRAEMRQPAPRRTRSRPRIVATMATLAGRERQLEQAVSSLLPQVDVLCVYLNGHKSIPSFLHHPKVAHATLSHEAGWRTAEAKLWFWDRDEFKAPPYWDDDDIALTVDDDIIYPADYAARMVAALERHPRSLVCVHASILMDPFETYGQSRWIARARAGLSADGRAHIPGTGTMAFRRGDLEVSLRRDVPWSHCVDVCAALAAKRQGLEVWAIARPEGWLHPLALPHGTGIFRQRTGAGNDGAETQLLLEAGPWESLPTQGFEARRPLGRAIRRRRPQIDRSTL